MTFCLGMKLESGLVAIADTRITCGNDVTTARKLSTYAHLGHRMFMMTSGLRSARDKVVTYFDQMIEDRPGPFGRIYEAASAIGQQIRRVAQEDRASLEAVGLRFDIQCLIGGQLAADAEPKLYLVYSEGNWIEVTHGTPFHVIGSGAYGKPILRRGLHAHDSLAHALKIGMLAFDSTRLSASDVDFPVDIVLCPAGADSEMVERRLEVSDMAEASRWWQEHLRQGIEKLPTQWLSKLIAGAAEEEGTEPGGPLAMHTEDAA